MKQKLLIFLATALAVSHIQLAWAQYPDPFLNDDQRPNGLKWIPAPPVATSGAFYNDYYYHQWGKEQRSQVGEKALWDEGVELYEAFSEVFGLTLNRTNTPEIVLLAEKCVRDVHLANKKVKNYYQRRRPFATFNEPSLKPWEDEEEAKTFSYPSGHSSRGWMFAMVLTTVAPELTEVLMARAREYAEHRIVCGHHWKSDIDAALMLSAGIFARLVATEDYQQQLQKAREEYSRLTQKKE